MLTKNNVDRKNTKIRKMWGPGWLKTSIWQTKYVKVWVTSDRENQEVHLHVYHLIK